MLLTYDSRSHVPDTPHLIPDPVEINTHCSIKKMAYSQINIRKLCKGTTMARDLKIIVAHIRVGKRHVQEYHINSTTSDACSGDLFC